MNELQRRVPTWALVGVAVLLLLLVVLGLLASVYLGLAIVLIALLAAGAYVAWTRLPERYEEGPDKAERKELDKHREAMEEQERERQEKERQRKGETGEDEPQDG